MPALEDAGHYSTGALSASQGMEPLKHVLQGWVTQRGFSWSWKLGDNVGSNVPAFASTPSGCTHISPGGASSGFLQLQYGLREQFQGILKPRASTLCPCHPTGAMGPWAGVVAPEHCCSQGCVCQGRAQHSSTSRGRKRLSHSAPCKWMPHASFPGEEGPFRLFLAPGGQREGVPLTSCYRL